MASEQIEQDVSNAAMHPARGRRRKVKGPLSSFPQLPSSALQHRLDTSSDEFEGQNAIGQGPKRLRSASTTPISDSGRAKAPFEWDNLMGIGPVSSTLEETLIQKEPIGKREQLKTSLLKAQLRVLGTPFW